jgi:hypothetical protein
MKDKFFFAAPVFKRLYCLVFTSALVGISSSAALAGGVTAPTAKIILIENGWYGEGLALITDGAGVSGCAGGPTQFAIDAGHPAYKDMVAMALTAFSSGSNVQMMVDQGNCIFGARTKVISLRLMK